MSQLNKPIMLAALAFCALAFAQGPLPPTGGAAGPGAPGGAAVSGAALNQSAAIASTTFATCPAGTANFCTYLVGVQLECNPANPGTGTGTLSGNLIFSDAVTANYNTAISQINVATCASAGGTFATQWLPRYIMVKPGTTVSYSTTGTMTGSYNYDLAWFAQRLS